MMYASLLSTTFSVGNTPQTYLLITFSCVRVPPTSKCEASTWHLYAFFYYGAQIQLRKDRLFQNFKPFIALFIPFRDTEVYSTQSSLRSCNHRKIMNKTSIKLQQSYESPYCGKIFWFNSLAYHSNLFRIYTNAVLNHDYTEKCGFHCQKHTLTRWDVKWPLLQKTEEK